MDKLKAIMEMKKPKEKVTIQKQLASQKKQQFYKSKQQEKKAKQTEQQKKLQQISEFYSKPRKMVKRQQQPTPPIPVDEVKQQLRKLFQPVTLFGQSPYRRYERLLKVQKFHNEHPNEDMKLYDQQFLKQIKENEEYEELDAKYRDLLIEPKILNDSITRKKKEELISKEGKKSFSQMCDEIHLWIIKVLKGWGQALQQKYEDGYRNENQNKSQLLQETTNQLRTFYQVLKKKSGDKQMIESIYYIMNCCLIRQYVQANSRYIQLSIGNAPWPMGVAMLGITVRKNAQRLSYVLDNEITRKWILGIKRLITVSQQLYPNEDPMRMVAYTVLKMT